MLSEMNEVWSYLLYNKVYEGRHIGMLDNFLIKLFFEGKCLEAYKVFGAHPDKKGVRFTVYDNKIKINILADITDLAEMIFFNQVVAWRMEM